MTIKVDGFKHALSGKSPRESYDAALAEYAEWRTKKRMPPATISDCRRLKAAVLEATGAQDWHLSA